MFTAKQQRQLNVRSWPQFTVPLKKPDGTKLTMRELRAWCKNNIVGEYRLEAIKQEPVFAEKPVTIGVLARIADPEDQVLFKLRWHDFR